MKIQEMKLKIKEIKSKIQKANMKKLLESRHFLMMVSLIAATLLWVYVIQVENPVFQLTVADVPVTFENTSVLENSGLMMTYHSADKVSMKISGRRKTVSSVDKREILATVDLKNITEPGEYTMTVAVDFPESSISIADRTPKIDIIIESIGRKTLPVEVSVEGQAAKGYYAAYTDPALNVEVTAPESLIDNITSARAVINADGEKSDFDRTVPVKLYSADGSVIDSELVRIYNPYAYLTCRVYPTKTVPVTWMQTGYSSNISSVSASVTSIELAGSKEALDEISSVYLGELYLPSLSSSSPSKTYELSEISELSGLIVTKNIKSVTLTASFSSSAPVQEEEDDEPVKTSATIHSISLSPAAEGMTAQLVTSSVNVEYMAESDTMNHYISAYADVSGLSEGEHDVPLVITASDDVEIIGSYTVRVIITANSLPAEEAEADMHSEIEI